MTLATTWSTAMGLDVPIVNAPMGGAAGGRLAAAVSAAGGLGMIGMGSAATPDQLRRELAILQGLDRPFGIGLVHWVMVDRPELFEIALAAQPTLLSVSFGDDWDWVRHAHDAGVKVATQVPTVDAARRAADAGVDVLVARGAEGGGHGEPTVGTLPLLAEVLDAVELPVLAAGGITSPRSVAAVLAAGAAAAWLGTVFTTCAEALTPDAARDALLAGTETELTREFDVAAGYRWPPTIPERVLRGSSVNAGQGVGMVNQALPAAQTIERLCWGAEALLRRWV
ncbi:2-nitropropane dioxygenase [Mycolicibacterium wolinskyi]|uniref:2-nitropropane dioxygenase n=2 Tax=Mycolicibacterium wolinskyi TaxID=59750 RepID=A0A132PUL7_9MYCO|nr:2-nitropropane dioxygenase [Mycolicibacterium wolinskyi]